MNDNDIIAAFRSGNDQEKEAAGTQLFRDNLGNFKKLILSFQYEEDGLESDVINLFNEAFISLINIIHNPNWKLNKARLSTYFYRIAHNIMIQKLRKKKNVAYEDDVQEGNLEDFLLEEEEQQKIILVELRKTAFSQLTAGCQDILYEKNRHLLEDTGSKITWEELARQWNKSAKYLKKKASECRKKLDKILKDLMQKNPALPYGNQ